MVNTTQYDSLWDDVDALRERDYAMLTGWGVASPNELFDAAAQAGAIFRVQKIDGVMVTLEWQDANGNPVTEMHHVADVSVVVHGSMKPPGAAESELPVHSLTMQTMKAFEDEYTRVTNLAMETWGQIPFTFHEFVTGKIDFAANDTMLAAPLDALRKQLRQRDAHIALLIDIARTAYREAAQILAYPVAGLTLTDAAFLNTRCRSIIDMAFEPATSTGDAVNGAAVELLREVEELCEENADLHERHRRAITLIRRQPVADSLRRKLLDILSEIE